jgi:hypothetical protein
LIRDIAYAHNPVVLIDRSMNRQHAEILPPMPEQPLKRSEIAKILRRHEGAKAEVARRAGVKNNTVSMWLAGSPSTNVSHHAEVYARELLAKEEADRIAKGEANGPSVRKVLPEIRKQSSSESQR